MLKPKRICTSPGCRELVSEGRCVAHKRPHTERHSAVYDSVGWKEYSRGYVARNPFCADPYGRHRGQRVAASCTGHKVAHRGDMRLFRDPANHTPLCNSCNAFMCTTFEGGFGNARRVE